MRILVVGGGISDEREVSLRSAQAVVEAAKKAGYQVDFYDWDGSKEWLKTNAPHYQVVLPILHGKGGEDGQIQEILEALNVKYLGSQPEAARVCFDKKQARQLVEKLGFKVPKGAVMGYESYTHSELVNRPHVVKPVMGGSSIHTHIVKDIVHMDVPAIEETFRIYNKLLVEECIIGVEVTAAVLDGVDMPLVEINLRLRRTHDHTTYTLQANLNGRHSTMDR